jgi:DNA-binding MarR family transcriptional regulator
VVDRLERADLVARRPHDIDRRSVVVALVPAGLGRLASGGDRPLAGLERLVRRRTTDELAIISRFLEEIARAVVEGSDAGQRR